MIRPETRRIKNFLRRFILISFAVVIALVGFTSFLLRDNPAEAASVAWTTGSPIDDLQLSFGSSCAQSDGKAYCWGGNTFGELGDGGSTNPRSYYARPVDTSGVLLNKSITSLSVAENTRVTCAIADGKAYCWGLNTYNMLGTDTIALDEPSYIPVEVNDDGVLAGKVVTKIDVGYYATCAIASGKAYCWGSNLDGMLGNGTNDDSAVPVAVDTSGPLSGKTVTDIEVGFQHVCVIADGEVFCWGNNANNGILGDGTFDNSTVPVALSASSDISDRVATKLVNDSYYHMCVMTDTVPYCWGSDSSGELGRGSSPGNPTIPQAIDTSGVLNGKTITSLEVGVAISCAIADSNAYCWGLNTYGRLGIGLPVPDGPGPSSVNTPTAVDSTGVLSGKSVSDLSIASVSSGSVCVIADGKAYCWGDGEYGMRGDGELTGAIGVPVEVYAGGDLLGKTLTKISTALNSSCAVSTTNEVFCWGKNVVGQLGSGDTTMTGLPSVVRSEPIQLDSLSVTSMAYPYEAGQSVEIYGQGILHGAAVSFGSEQADVLNNNFNSGFIEVEIPPGDPGVVDVTVTNPDGSSATLTNAFTYEEEPVEPTMTINSISPDTIETDTSGTATISVNNFIVGGTVKVGGNNATISSATTSSITIQVPISSTPGSVDIVVTNPSGQVATLTNGFEYIHTVIPPKVIDNVSFSTEDGKKLLTVTGSGLVGQTDPSEYFEGTQRSLVTLNTVVLPFCTDGTSLPLDFFLDNGVSAELVSDSPPCYYLLDASFDPLIDTTHAVIFLADNFDITAEGTVSVNGSVDFTFNEEEDEETDPPTTGGSGGTTGEGGGSTSSTATTTTTTPTTTTTTTTTTEPTLTADDKPVSGTPEISSKPTFSGYADPFSTVTVTVHSDPVTCTTTADSTGYWSCTLSSDLPAGMHTVKVKVVGTDGTTTELGPYTVFVKEGDATPVITSETEEDAAVPTASFPWIWLILGGGVIVVIIIAFIARRHSAQP